MKAVPALKRVILETNNDGLRDIAYESLLSILGKGAYDLLVEGVDKPTIIDWDLVRSL